MGLQLTRRIRAGDPCECRFVSVRDLFPPTPALLNVSQLG